MGNKKHQTDEKMFAYLLQRTEAILEEHECST